MAPEVDCSKRQAPPPAAGAATSTATAGAFGLETSGQPAVGRRLAGGKLAGRAAKAGGGGKVGGGKAGGAAARRTQPWNLETRPLRGQRRCAWTPPSACWRAEYLTTVELQRSGRVRSGGGADGAGAGGGGPLDGSNVTSLAQAHAEIARLRALLRRANVAGGGAPVVGGAAASGGPVRGLGAVGSGVGVGSGDGGGGGGAACSAAWLELLELPAGSKVPQLAAACRAGAKALALEEVAGLEAELMRAPLRPKAGLAGQQDAGWLEVLQANTSGVAMGRWDAGCIDFLQKQAI